LFVNSFFLSTPVATVAWIFKTEAGLENSDDDEDGLQQYFLPVLFLYNLTPPKLGLPILVLVLHLPFFSIIIILVGRGGEDCVSAPSEEDGIVKTFSIAKN
jgi:hypothetical protein